MSANQSSMRIGFCGSHSTGKTTVANMVHNCFIKMDKRSVIISGHSRKLANRGYRLGIDAGVDLNLAHLSGFINNVTKCSADIQIWDRTIVDLWAYASLSPRVPAEFLGLVEAISNLQLLKPDVLFYFPLNVDFELDGVRPSSIKYRCDVDKQIVEAMRKFKLPSIALEGDAESRSDQILGIVSEKQETK